MMATGENRFQDFFEDEKYTTLKNHLYNYQIRKKAVEREMSRERKDLVLEIGSGISPVLTTWDRIVYSDLSSEALDTLKRMHGKGRYVRADAMNLPFDDGSFSHVIASEVLEHLKDDRKALAEIARVLRSQGYMIITFPHRRFYFSHDDRFVHHFRRYELDEMLLLLEQAGFQPVDIQKILGPLEKITMMMATRCASVVKKVSGRDDSGGKKKKPSKWIIDLFKWCNRFYAVIVKLDAFIMPRALSSVLLIKAQKVN